MRRLRRLAIAGLLAQACVGSGYRSHDGLLTYGSDAFSLPDLSHLGWQRVDVEDADLAFRGASGQTIAIRASCGHEPPRSLEWAARSRFLGAGLETGRPQHRLVDGHSAMEVEAHGKGLQVAAVLIWTGRCLVDLAYAAPAGAAHPAAFEDFVSGLRAPHGSEQTP